jgi:hypothetical protein
LDDVTQINILVKDKITPVSDLSEEGEASLQFVMGEGQIIVIPFTQVNLVQQWYNYLQEVCSKNDRDN